MPLLLRKKTTNSNKAPSAINDGSPTDSCREDDGCAFAPESIISTKIRKPRIPVRLGSLRYVDYNRQTESCSVHKVLDAAGYHGMPILAHFCVPGDAHQDAVVAQLFSEPLLVQVVEECFVPAFFHAEACHKDPEQWRYLRQWFRPCRTETPMHRLRIVSHDGKHIVGAGSDNLVADRQLLPNILMQALQELHRHVPEKLYYSVKNTEENSKRHKLEQTPSKSSSIRLEI